MQSQPYIIKRGDTLWGIAGTHLGNPQLWPELYEFNNTPAVIAKTGFKIANPDLIFIGQKLFIPKANSAPTNKRPIPSAKPVPAVKPSAAKKPAAKKVRSVPLKYELDKLPSITIASPTHIATISLKGSITLQSKDSVEFATLTRQGFELAAKREADHALGKLVTNTQLGYNPSTNEVNLEIGITSQSNSPYSPKTTLAAGVSSKTGLPVLKGSITAPEIKGKVDNFIYVSADLGFAIELTPRLPTAKPIPVPVRVPSAKPLPQRDGWDYLWGSLLVAGAGVIIVATIGEDVVTLGAGVADDVPSFAAASAMFAGGMLLFQPVSGGAPIEIEGHGVVN